MKGNLGMTTEQSTKLNDIYDMVVGLQGEAMIIVENGSAGAGFSNNIQIPSPGIYVFYIYNGAGTYGNPELTISVSSTAELLYSNFSNKSDVLQFMIYRFSKAETITIAKGTASGSNAAYYIVKLNKI